jgi:hypothetical protein
VVSLFLGRVPAKKRYLLVDSLRMCRVPVTNRALQARRVCFGDVALNWVEDRRELYIWWVTNCRYNIIVCFCHYRIVSEFVLSLNRVFLA